MSYSLRPLSPLGAVNETEQDRRSGAERSLDLQATANSGPAEKFSDRDSRLRTFVNWPLEHPSPESLAAKGYCYRGHGNKIVCTGCDETFGGLKPGDDPDTVHEQHMPDCVLLRSRKIRSKMEEVHENFMRDIEESKSTRKMEEEQENVMRDIEPSSRTLMEYEEKMKQMSKELVQTEKEKERYKSDNRRLKRELKKARPHRRSNVDAVRTEEEYRAQEEIIKKTQLEIVYLSDRLEQETADQREVDSMKDTILQQKLENKALLTACDDLFDRNKNLLSVVKQQARINERLYLENIELKRKGKDGEGENTQDTQEQENLDDTVCDREWFRSSAVSEGQSASPEDLSGHDMEMGEKNEG